MLTKNSALLLSGGMDSVAIAYWFRPEHAITIDYGQRPARAEIKAARAVCDALDIGHHVITVDCSSIGVGDLVNRDNVCGAPAPEWWPFRNQLLITLAATKAVTLGCSQLFIGTLATDERFADGSPAFLDTMDALLRLQEGGLRLIAPARELNAVELVRASQVPSSVLQWAFSCHVAEIACGHCRGCIKQRKTKRVLAKALELH